MVDCGLNPEQVSGRAEAGDLSQRHTGDVGPVPERFTLVDIRQVDLDGRNGDSCDGIPKRHAGVRIPGGVDHDRMKTTLGLLDPGHQLPFNVGLPDCDGDTFTFGELGDRGIDRPQRRIAVHRLLAVAQQIQVGSVENEYVKLFGFANCSLAHDTAAMVWTAWRVAYSNRPRDDGQTMRLR